MKTVWKYLRVKGTSKYSCVFFESCTAYRHAEKMYLHCNSLCTFWSFLTASEWNRWQNCVTHQGQWGALLLQFQRDIYIKPNHQCVGVKQNHLSLDCGYLKTNSYEHQGNKKMHTLLSPLLALDPLKPYSKSVMQDVPSVVPLSNLHVLTQYSSFHSSLQNEPFPGPTHKCYIINSWRTVGKPLQTDGKTKDSPLKL